MSLVCIIIKSIIELATSFDFYSALFTIWNRFLSGGQCNPRYV